MQQPLQITFRDMEPSAAVEARVRALAERLERFGPNITSCHVVIREPHQHSQQGRLFDVHIRLGVPGKEIAIAREGSKDHAHEDAYVAIRDAFEAAARQLEDYVRTRDHRMRPHELPPHGTVTRIFPQDGYGFVDTDDGLEVYFHENAVVDGKFADLELGDEVRLEIAERESENGPQATMLKRIGHRSPA